MKPTILALLGLLVLMTGCHNDQPSGEFPEGNDAIPPYETRQVNRFMAAQEANGARHDAMLYDHHFNGPNLNSLGQERLSRMAHVGDSGFPVVVYMNMPQDAAAADRKAAVVAFLKDQGLLESQIDIRAGYNPDASSSAAANISDLDNLNSGASTSTPSPAPGAPGAPGTPASSPGNGVSTGGGGPTAPAGSFNPQP